MSNCSPIIFQAFLFKLLLWQKKLHFWSLVTFLLGIMGLDKSLYLISKRCQKKRNCSEREKLKRKEWSGLFFVACFSFICQRHKLMAPARNVLTLSKLLPNFLLVMKWWTLQKRFSSKMFAHKWVMSKGFTQMFFDNFSREIKAKKSKTTTFSRVFHPKNRHFSMEIKIAFLDKKWRFRTVWLYWVSQQVLVGNLA